MPTYHFKNTITGEIIEKYCSMTTRQEMVDSGEWEMHHTEGSTLVSSVGIKPDSTFRDLLKEMKKKHNQGITKSTINDW